MACPFFMPVNRLDPGAWTHAPRLPLGDPYSGVCHSCPGEPFEPEASQRDLCNHGYARGQCDRFPGDSPADAVRFSVINDRDGRVDLIYILEKDHAPVSHGKLEYPYAGANELIQAQAQAFAESLLRRVNPKPCTYT